MNTIYSYIKLADQYDEGCTVSYITYITVVIYNIFRDVYQTAIVYLCTSVQCCGPCTWWRAVFFLQEYIPIWNKNFNAEKKARNIC